MTLKIGIVGTGFGRRVHVPAFRQDQRCRIEAICSRNATDAEKAAKELDIPKFFDDWRKLVADPLIDAISIAVPPLSQPEIALSALENGKHVFLEKPVGSNSRNAAPLLETARASQLANMVDFELPELDTFQRAKSILTGGELGKITRVAVTWHVGDYNLSDEPVSWKSSGAEGGGTLNLFGSHVLHYLEWLLGVDFQKSFPVSVSLARIKDPGSVHKIEIEGKSSSLILENTSPDYVQGFVLKLLTAKNHSPKVILKEPSVPLSPDGRIYAVGRVVKKFIDWIEKGEPQRPNLYDGCHVDQLMEYLRTSNDKNGWINLEGKEIDGTA